MRITPLQYLLSCVFITTLIVSNIIAVKIGDFFGVFFPVGVIIFPLSYVIGDVITEVYGYSAMRRVIWTGFFCNLLAVAAFTVGKMIPSAPFFQGQDAYVAILGSTPRLLGASFVAYLCGSFSNAAILSKLKVKTGGKHLWFRTIASTIVGEGLDSLIFITLAFGGVFASAEIITLVWTQWLFKVAFEAAITPLTYGVVTAVKRREQIDTFDTSASFNPFHF